MSIEHNKEYNTLIEKLEGFITANENRVKSRGHELEKQHAKVEYALQKLTENKAFDKTGFLKIKQQS
jgi:hypothetical protein